MSFRLAHPEEKSSVRTVGDSEATLWHLFFSTKNATARLQLIELYMPFARMLAAKMYSRRQGLDAPFEDYFHNAALALIQAVDRYDPFLTASFKTFAHYRIEGAILNELPKLSEQHAQVGLITRLRKDRLESLSESGSEAKKSRSKGSTFEDMVELAVGLSIGYMLEGSGMYCDETQTDDRDSYSNHAVKQLGIRLKKMMELLPEKERTVIRYHYFFGLGTDEIATQMKLSKGRISQLHKEGLKQLKNMAEAAHFNLSL